jgi:hypothetical protein
MALHVVHADERKLARPSGRFGEAVSDEQRTHQTWSRSCRDRVEIGGVNARFSQRPVGKRPDCFDMSAGRNLRDNASKARVQLCLRGEDRRQDLIPAHYRDRGLIAAGLEGED